MNIEKLEEFYKNIQAGEGMTQKQWMSLTAEKRAEIVRSTLRIDNNSFVTGLDTEYKGRKKELWHIPNYNFYLYRNAAVKNVIISAIIQKRISQIKQYTSIAKIGKTKGFNVIHKNKKLRSHPKIKYIQNMLEHFILNTHMSTKPINKRDCFNDFCSMLTRDILTVDTYSIELQKEEVTKNVIGYTYVDPTSIREYKAPYSDTFYCQVSREESKLLDYNNDSLIYGICNHRSDLEHRNTPFSLVEQSLEAVTTFIYAQAYNKDLFVKDSIPKGFLSVHGAPNAELYEKIRNEWTIQMRGYKGKHSVPIIATGLDGKGVKWNEINSNLRDMEFKSLFLLTASLIGSVFNIDLAEIGLKTDNSTSLISEKGGERIQESKEGGLGGLLFDITKIMNKIISNINPNYEFIFTGTDMQGGTIEIQKLEKEVTLYKTVNEIRENEGLEKLDIDIADMPLNANFLQAYMQTVNNPDYIDNNENQEEGESNLDDDIKENIPQLIKSKKKKTYKPKNKKDIKKIFLKQLLNEK